MISFYPTFSSKRITAFLGQLFFFFLVTCGLLFFAQSAHGQTVKGTVYRDFNENGTKDNTATFNEIGVGRVLVCAYKPDGSLADSTRTATDGTYTLTTGAGNLRIEFKQYPTGFFDAKAGGTTVQFVAGGATGVNVGINCPVDYCQANPKVVTPCYENGSGVGNTNPVVVGIDYTDSGVSTQNQYATNGTAVNMGTTWGVAYDKKTKLTYFSSFLKRQAGFGTRGADGIYVLDYSGATATLVGGFDLQGVVPSNGGAAISLGTVTRTLIASGNGTGVNDLSASRTNASRDADAYGKVGKMSYGDIDIDETSNTLWAVNLFERSLIAVDISSNVHAAANPTTLASAKVRRYFIDGVTSPFISGLPTAASGTLRPFALGFHKGLGYLGVVDDGASLSTVDMTASQKAYVLSFDPVNPTAFTLVTSIPLNYAREQGWVPFAPLTTFDALESDQWQRWKDTYVQPSGVGSTQVSTNDDIKTGINGTFAGDPQPILSDIEFLPNGDMVLGFMDRFAHQQGWSNLIPTSTTVLSSAVSQGDILLASKTTTGFTFEGPNENDNFTTPAVAANAQPGQKLNDGPSGAGEFFYTDYFIGSDASHPETALGGLAVLQGSNEVTAISFDPAAFNSMGVRWLNYNTGVQSRVYTIAANTDIANFGKGSGLGDVEILCDLPPLEIGNRIWKDADGDGIQDPGEPPLVGVTVQLYTAAGVAIAGATATTDASGNYIFSSTTIAALLPNTSYQVRVTAMGSNASVTGLTLTNLTTLTPGEAAATNTGTTLANNDAKLVSGVPTIALTTGDWGENNHTYDIGFYVCVKPTVTPTVTQATCNGNTTNSDAKITFTATNADKYDIVVGASYTGTATYATATALAAGAGSKTGLSNPAVSTQYTIRVFNGTDACFKDTTVTLNTTACPLGSIGDYVWTDTNNDGQQTSGEAPIAGVKVYLLNAAGVKLDSTVTDALGKYLFDSLSTGSYKVKFVSPAGMIPAKQNTGADVTDSDANKLGLSQLINIDTTKPVADTLRNNPQIDAGFVPVGSLGNYVFNDKNGNGIQDATDTAIPNVKVYLLNSLGAKIDSTVTNAQGKYLFDSLLAGTYSVKFVIPAGSEATLKTQGGDTTKDSNINPDGTTDAITIDTTLPIGNVGRDNPTIDAGIKQAYGSIGDYVWSDNNNNGQQDGTEPPIKGVKVYLYNVAGTVKLDSTVTDALGKYTFDSLLTGAYKVKFVAPTGTIPAKQNLGADITDSDVNKLGFSQVINIDTTKPSTDTLRNNPQIDAGFVPVGSIGDYVFNDKDNSNTQTAGDTPVSGVKVYLLDGTTGAKLDSTVTDGAGKYLFDSLLAGNYKIQFVKPAGTSLVTKAAGGDITKDSNPDPTTGISDVVTLDTTQPLGDPARDNRDVDAGIKTKPVYGSLGDYVWTDTNNNGQQDGTEAPIKGVKVYLYDGTGTTKLDSTTTDALGKYTFDSLLTGSYKVKFVAPAGMIATKQNLGADVSDSDANKLGWSQVVNINTTLLPTDTLRNNPQIDAGFVPVGSLGDYVFNDKDLSNTQTAGDTPVPGVKVYLIDGTTGAELDSTITDITGEYLFDSLLAGNYKVQFVAPTGGTFVTPTQGGDPTKDSNPDGTGLTGVITLDTTQPVGSPNRDNRDADAGIKGIPLTYDLSLKKCISKKKAVIGDLITYTLVVKNEGQGDATGVAVQDTLNSGVQFQSSTLVHGTGAYNNITGEWFIGKVAKGDSAVLNITVKVLKIGLWFNIAEISKMSEKDIDSTPGNGKDGEDDIDRQCFTVPITLCTNETVLATVPKQYSGVTWYKNGQQVGSGNTYTISATGSYTYTAINGSCPASGCCPIEVTVIDCCKPDVCVPFTVKKVKP